MKKHLGGFEFELVGELKIDRDPEGELIAYVPKLPEGVQSNPWASGPFCRFVLLGATEQAGVYAVYVADELMYIGQTTNLSFRFGPDSYGEITWKNCRSRGQSTSCKVNAGVLEAARDGKLSQVWFHQSFNKELIEADLIRRESPPWNGRIDRAALTSADGTKRLVDQTPRLVKKADVF